MASVCLELSMNDLPGHSGLSRDVNAMQSLLLLCGDSNSGQCRVVATVEWKLLGKH